MGMEIERRWLLKDLPDLFCISNSLLTQSYIAKNPEVRLRKSTTITTVEGNLQIHYYLTIKQPSKSYLARVENEVEITPEQYNELFQSASSVLVKERRRYELYASEKVLEVSIINRHTQGTPPLILAEVEFDSEAEAILFSPKEFQDVIIKEVTAQKQYKSKNLARRI